MNIEEFNLEALFERLLDHQSLRRHLSYKKQECIQIYKDIDLFDRSNRILELYIISWIDGKRARPIIYKYDMI